MSSLHHIHFPQLASHHGHGLNQLHHFPYQVYQEVTDKPENREFNSVLTYLDMYEQMRMQTQDFVYHRIPMNDDAAPAEKVMHFVMHSA